MRWLLLAYTTAILVTAVCAVVEIETIIISGPCLSAYGLFIAFLSFRRHRLMGLLYGLAAPSAAALCLLVIVALDWGPGEAHVPISLFIATFGLLCIPICSVAVMELETSGNTPPRARLQFSIASLLVLMLVLAFVLGLARWAGARGAAWGITSAYFATAVYVMSLFFRNRRLQKLAGRSSFLVATPASRVAENAAVAQTPSGECDKSVERG